MPLDPPGRGLPRAALEYAADRLGVRDLIGLVHLDAFEIGGDAALADAS